jgi:Virulence factor
MATLTTIWWRDIPMQVIAKSGREAHKIVLHPRFQVAVDRAAVKAGKKSASDYIEEMRREARACGDDLKQAATTEADRLDSTYSREVLARLIDAGGVDATRSTGATETGAVPGAPQPDLAQRDPAADA